MTGFVIGLPPQYFSDWCSDHPEVHGWLFPLCWEAMLKRHNEWSDDKRWVFHRMLRGDPNAELNELTVEVRFWYLRAIAETQNERHQRNLWASRRAPRSSGRTRAGCRRCPRISTVRSAAP
jgi:hypothetical protein